MTLITDWKLVSLCWIYFPTYWKTKKCQAANEQIDVLRAFLQFCLSFSDDWFYSYFHSFKHVTSCRIERDSYMYNTYSSPVTSDIFMLGWIRSFLEDSRVMRDDPRASRGKYPRLAIKTARDSCEVHAIRTQNPCEFLVFLPWKGLKIPAKHGVYRTFLATVLYIMGAAPPHPCFPFL